MPAYLAPIATLCCVYSPYRHRAGRCSSPAVATQLALLARPLCSLSCWLTPACISARSELPACLFVRWVSHLTNSSPLGFCRESAATCGFFRFSSNDFLDEKRRKCPARTFSIHGWAPHWAGVSVCTLGRSCRLSRRDKLAARGMASPHSTQQNHHRFAHFCPPWIGERPQ